MDSTFIIILLSFTLCFLVILTPGYYIVNWNSITTFIQGICSRNDPGQDTVILTGLPQNLSCSNGYSLDPAHPTSMDLGDIPMQLIHPYIDQDLEMATSMRRNESDTQSERTVRPKGSREAWNAEFREYLDLFTLPKRYVSHGHTYSIFRLTWRNNNNNNNKREARERNGNGRF